MTDKHAESKAEKAANNQSNYGAPPPYAQGPGQPQHGVPQQVSQQQQQYQGQNYGGNQQPYQGQNGGYQQPYQGQQPEQQFRSNNPYSGSGGQQLGVMNGGGNGARSMSADGRRGSSDERRTSSDERRGSEELWREQTAQ